MYLFKLFGSIALMLLGVFIAVGGVLWMLNSNLGVENTLASVGFRIGFAVVAVALGFAVNGYGLDIYNGLMVYSEVRRFVRRLQLRSIAGALLFISFVGVILSSVVMSGPNWDVGSPIVNALGPWALGMLVLISSAFLGIIGWYVLNRARSLN